MCRTLTEQLCMLRVFRLRFLDTIALIPRSVAWKENKSDCCTKEKEMCSFPNERESCNVREFTTKQSLPAESPWLFEIERERVFTCVQPLQINDVSLWHPMANVTRPSSVMFVHHEIFKYTRCGHPSLQREEELKLPSRHNHKVIDWLKNNHRSGRKISGFWHWEQSDLFTANWWPGHTWVPWLLCWWYTDVNRLYLSALRVVLVIHWHESRSRCDIRTQWAPKLWHVLKSKSMW